MKRKIATESLLFSSVAARLPRTFKARIGVLLLFAMVTIPSLNANTAFAQTVAVPANEFLNTIGANSSVNARGETLQHTADCVTYLGLRWLRTGIEDKTPVNDFIALHDRTGVRFGWLVGSGGTDTARLIDTARQLASHGALLAIEGPNEPNNWGFTYQGQPGGGQRTWLPVAKYQRDLYDAVKKDPVLHNYPVWGTTENGAEMDNVGLQFILIPAGAGTLMPEGTRYADYANVHNYMYHPSWPGLHDNETWIASDPSSATRVDGLYGNHGLTWAHKYTGYSEAALSTLPRVTTETGTTIDSPVTEHVQALNYMSVYLDQFKRGWSYTSIYIMRDRSDESGNQTYGFFKPDYTPRQAAVYLHNLTTILRDNGPNAAPGKLGYSIPDQPATVHDLLLQKSDGAFELVVWDERVSGSDNIVVHLGGIHPSVKVYDPTVGVAAIRSLRKIESLPLTLSDHPVIVEIPAVSRR